MSLQVEKLEKNMAKLTIEVSAEDLEKAMQAAYQKAKGRITLPGFRKGKAPRKMIEQMYGKGIFLEDAANALIPEQVPRKYLSPFHRGSLYIRHLYQMHRVHRRNMYGCLQVTPQMPEQVLHTSLRQEM